MPKEKGARSTTDNDIRRRRSTITRSVLLGARGLAGGTKGESEGAGVVLTSTAGQEFAVTQHDGNQLAGSSSTKDELSDRDEVRVDAADKEQVQEKSAYRISKGRGPTLTNGTNRRHTKNATKDNPISVTRSPQCGLAGST